MYPKQKLGCIHEFRGLVKPLAPSRLLSELELNSPFLSEEDETERTEEQQEECGSETENDNEQSAGLGIQVHCARRRDFRRNSNKFQNRSNSGLFRLLCPAHPLELWTTLIFENFRINNKNFTGKCRRIEILRRENAISNALKPEKITKLVRKVESCDEYEKTSGNISKKPTRKIRRLLEWSKKSKWIKKNIKKRKQLENEG